MRISISASDAVKVIDKALESRDINDARNLFYKNKEVIKNEFPERYAELEKIFDNAPRNKKEKPVSLKPAIPKAPAAAPKKKPVLNEYCRKIIKHLKEGRPIPAYQIFETYKPISKEQFIALCEKIIDSNILKETMNYSRATVALRRIISSLESGVESDNIFVGIVSGVSGNKSDAKRKKIPIYEIRKPYPEIVYGDLSIATERTHVSWFDDYAKYKKTALQQAYADAEADLIDLSSDMRYLNWEQRLDAIAERELLTRSKGYIKKSIANVGRITNEPFFARVDYERVEGDRENKIVYISKNGNIEDYPSKKDKVHYSDWRAPVGDLFYKTNGAIGKTFFAGGDVDVVLNGRIVVRNGEVVKVDSDSSRTPAGVIGDDILQERLSQSSGDKMGEVVETIQIEQNEIIRHTGDRDLIIQGSAGSGKTIIGMHRIAYLMYTESIQNDSIIFVSPNSNFSKYVSDVLPELGENNMPIVTMADIIGTVLSSLEAGGLSEDLEGFAPFIEKYYSDGYNDGVARKYFGEFGDRFSRIADSVKYDSVSFDLGSIMGSELNAIKIANRKNDAALIYSSLLGIGDFAERYKYENSVFAAILWAKISNTILKLKPKSEYGGDKYVLCSENDIDKMSAAQKQHEELMKSVYDKAKKRVVEEDEGSRGILDGRKYVYTEEAIRRELETKHYMLIGRTFLNTKKQYYPTHDHSSVLHVVVDEAQDYSPWHIYLLKLVFPNAKFTILGDENQNLNPYLTFSKLKDLLPGSDYIGVRKAYRSSPEIIEYTNRILGENIRAVRKSNNIPVTELAASSYNDITKEELDASIERAARNGLKKIALICRDHSVKEYFVNMLADADENKRVSIYTTYEAKGLEFDAAIVIDTYLDGEKELFYTACTRAQHQLIVYKVSNKHKAESIFGRVTF